MFAVDMTGFNHSPSAPPAAIGQKSLFALGPSDEIPNGPEYLMGSGSAPSTRGLPSIRMAFARSNFESPSVCLVN